MPPGEAGCIIGEIDAEPKDDREASRSVESRNETGSRDGLTAAVLRPGRLYRERSGGFDTLMARQRSAAMIGPAARVSRAGVKLWVVSLIQPTR